MKRLNKINDARMVSARVERTDVEKFEHLLSQQPYVTLQDFISFTFRSFISGAICVDEGRLTIAHDR